MATTGDGEDTRRARVLFDFAGDEDNQLTIAVDDVITVIGQPTPENWVLARTADGIEGYIPDGYFQVLPNKPKRRKPPRAAPARPMTVADQSMASMGSAGSEGGYAVNDDDDDGIILEHNDTFSLFAYQLEWFTIPCLFLGALFSFMYSTPQTEAEKWRLGVCSWLTFIVAAIAAYICGIERNRFKIKESSAIVRMLVFGLATLLLFASYPIGIAAAMVSTLTALVELRLHLLKCKDLPRKVTDDWCATMFGGSGPANCPPLKLVIFFIVLAVDGAVFAWGFINGYNFALINNDENPSFYLQPLANAWMLGFGRIISVNLGLILLLACRGCFGFCAKTCRARMDAAGKKRAANKWTADVNVVGFLHRCLGYLVIFATFLHLICVYFTYEDSLATHTFLETYGWESFGTGWVAFLLLAAVVGGSNETLAKTNTRLFRQSHWQSLLLVLVLIFHGGGALSTYYWQLIIVPVVFYACDLVVRYCQSE